MNYTWDYTWVWRNWDVLGRGMLVTLLLTVVTVGCGAVLGAMVALLRQSRFKVIAWTARIFIEVFRDLPVLVVLIWLFFCLPILLGPGAGISPFWVAVIGLGLNFSALQAEIIRAGYEAIPAGQLEAAAGLRFSRWQVLRFIVLPQTAWRSIAPTLGQAVNTLKLTALASFISVGELFYVTGRLIQNTFRPLEFYTTLALLYLVLILPAAILVQLFEDRLSRRFRHA